ncbi:outer membrane protein transport protein, partial [bacterium]|nr:outer membrane protein transport protein [bacterium]
MKLLRILIVACAVSALGIVPAAASQLATANDYGLTARGIALGNAITAVEDDASLIFHNPAAMAKMDTGQINAGYLFTDPNLSGGPKGDLKDFGEGNNIVLTNMIINLRDFFRSKRPFNIGLSIALDDDGKSLIEFIDAEDEDGHFYRYGRTSSTMVTSAGLGITDWLYLGGGVYILLRGDTDFQVTTDLAGNTSNEGMALTATLAYSPIISAYLDFEKFNVGVAYHGENYGAFENINVEAEATVGDSPLTDLPMQLAFQDL